jgi:hypothetical protein
MCKDDLKRKIMDECTDYMSKRNKNAKIGCLFNYFLLWWLLMHEVSIFYIKKNNKVTK